MAQETIQNIKDAELKAQQTIKDAEAQRIALINKAREDGAAYKKEAADKANGLAKKAVAAVEETRDAAMVKATVRAEAIIKGFSGNLQGKKEKAINAVISEIA
ncbi:MAG: hypothetical protein IKF90_09625 [Parasporobacterium sp.]|nr:hypothetical protein [Parasporobacterium sp.]